MKENDQIKEKKLDLKDNPQSGSLLARERLYINNIVYNVYYLIFRKLLYFTYLVLSAYSAGFAADFHDKEENSSNNYIIECVFLGLILSDTIISAIITAFVSI